MEYCCAAPSRPETTAACVPHWTQGGVQMPTVNAPGSLEQ